MVSFVSMTRNWAVLLYTLPFSAKRRTAAGVVKSLWSFADVFDAVMGGEYAIAA